MIDFVINDLKSNFDPKVDLRSFITKSIKGVRL